MVGAFWSQVSYGANGLLCVVCMCAGVERVGVCCGDLSGLFFLKRKVSQASRGVEVYAFEFQGTST